MCLRGSLGDFAIQEILQILALGRKTGCLSLKTAAGGGAIVFREGRVLASVEDGGPSLEAALASWPGRRQDEVIRQRIAASLCRIARCRQGSFSFQVTAQPPQLIEGRDIASETLRPGIDVIELLLDVACSQDEEARAAPSVLLVDDEDEVRRLLAQCLVEGGYRVIEAGDVESAVERGAGMGEAGVRFVLVADLNMPASAGNSFRGGFEVVKRLAGLRPRPPVVIMADGASSSARAMPTRGGWIVVLKPGLSKLNAEEFEADLRALGGRMVREVLPRVCAGALPA